jgi:preprotein translocase subunit SecE
LRVQIPPPLLPELYEETDVPVSAFLQELMHSSIYKRSQGRITRQVTFGALALIVAMGLWRMSELLKVSHWALQLPGVYLWFPGLLLFAWTWISYRIVNFPPFADFLIAVEAEMNKVSWPTRTELFRASVVVLVTIFALAMILAGFDLFWRIVFHYMGIFS